MENTLASIYLDPGHPASLGGLDVVYRAVKQKGKNKISRKQVRDWLSQQEFTSPINLPETLQEKSRYSFWY